MSYDDGKFRELFEKLKVYSTNKDVYISKIIENVMFVLTSRRIEKNDNLDVDKVAFFTTRITDILKDLYEDYVDRSASENNVAEVIEYVGSGFTSITFRVGDNVIKFGKSEYDIAPEKLDSSLKVPIYMRESYEIDHKVHFRVEVAPFVDTTNITYEDTYEAYKNIRKLGYIWNDPKEENLGRIIGVSGCKIGGKQYLPTKQYQKGDLVVIDLDDIAYVGEETSDIILEEISMMSYNRNVYAFETRYWDEKRML